MRTLSGNIVQILGNIESDLEELLLKNRNIKQEDKKGFFHPGIEDLHDPYLLPDMLPAVTRILEARKKKERIVIFGDYDVDGVTATTILVRFLSDIGCLVSYRLPHRVHDGYGLKNYFFDELGTKDVKLVITVDCGTRDIEPVKHAKSLGIDVIITDHHAVPEIIPEEVIAIINPKRKDSVYPFRDLAGAGVAFKLVQALIQKLYTKEYHTDEISGPGVWGEGTVGTEMKNSIPMSKASTEGVGLPPKTFDTFGYKSIENTTLQKYIDFAALGTVADCMPLIGENRTITTIGLKQMKESESSGLRKFLGGKDPTGDADIIGFQIGPRINAAGRMDTPLKALQWLLAGDEKSDSLFAELESLNLARRETTDIYVEHALSVIDTTLPVLIYAHDEIEHGIIGLVAARLTSEYGKPSIALKIEGDEMIASCRSPEWCNIVTLLDDSKHFFKRYGGHRQAAGFTIETTKFKDFEEHILEVFKNYHDTENLPKQTLNVECILPTELLKTSTLDIINQFRPFGIGNRKPLFMLENLTVKESRFLGQDEKHLAITFLEIPNLKCIMWKSGEKKHHFTPGNILSPIVELEANIWQGKTSLNVIIKDILIG